MSLLFCHILISWLIGGAVRWRQPFQVSKDFLYNLHWLFKTILKPLSFCYWHLTSLKVSYGNLHYVLITWICFAAGTVNRAYIKVRSCNDNNGTAFPPDIFGFGAVGLLGKKTIFGKHNFRLRVDGILILKILRNSVSLFTCKWPKVCPAASKLCSFFVIVCRLLIGQHFYIVRV